MNDINTRPYRILPAQWGVAGLAVILTGGAVVYKILMHRQLGHSAAMFLGIPAILAILLALAPNARTVTGGILKGITLALLLVAPLLGEGYLCIVFASPLFYLVGIIVGLVIDYRRKKRAAALSCVALFLTPMCLEGVFPQLTFNRLQSVEATRILPLPFQSVEHSLASELRVNTPLPKLLRIGFPRPLSANGAGLAPGDRRTIHFSGAEGDPPGDLIMQVAESRPGFVRFDTVSDGSKLTQWVRWRSSEVEWRRLDPDHVAVIWRIHFERQLDPAWYFNLCERVAVEQAAEYLIDANIASERSK